MSWDMWWGYLTAGGATALCGSGASTHLIIFTCNARTDLPRVWRSPMPLAAQQALILPTAPAPQ